MEKTARATHHQKSADSVSVTIINDPKE